MNLSNYARALELAKYKTLNESLIQEADSDPAKALEQVKSGKNGGGYKPQWDQLVKAVHTDVDAGKTSGTVMIKHDKNVQGGADMVNIAWSIDTTGKVTLSVAQGGSSTTGTTSNPAIKLSDNVIAKLKAKIAYLTKATDIDENQLSYIIEAILYHATSHSFDEKTQLELINALFTSDQKKSVDSAYYYGNASNVAANGMAKALIYPGQVNINLESDEDCKQVVSIVGANPKIASINIDGAKIQSLAQAIFNITDDTFVGEDEELIACMGIVSLNRASLYKLKAEWNRIHKPNANGKDLIDFVGGELDGDDARKLLYAMYRGITGTPGDQAKELLAEPTEA